MGTQPTTALTETWDVPAPTGLLYLGIDVGRRKHLAAAIPEMRMWTAPGSERRCTRSPRPRLASAS
jgi:hypothetical protein